MSQKPGFSQAAMTHKAGNAYSLALAGENVIFSCVTHEAEVCGPESGWHYCVTQNLCLYAATKWG